MPLLTKQISSKKYVNCMTNELLADAEAGVVESTIVSSLLAAPQYFKLLHRGEVYIAIYSKKYVNCMTNLVAG